MTYAAAAIVAVFAGLFVVNASIEADSKKTAPWQKTEAEIPTRVASFILTVVVVFVFLAPRS